MEERFELPSIGNLDAKAEAAQFLAGIHDVVAGKIERVILEEFDGDITEVTPDDAARIVNSRFDKDTVGSFFKEIGKSEYGRN